VSGTVLGPYQILAKLGEGGMGEVYRARDSRLQREVAIKILPASFAADADRLMRFEREAQTLAALNHRHIAQIQGLEESSPGGSGPPIRALVMEFVDGEGLDARLARGPLPIDDAIAIARQIAEALEAAHERGIVHRDLKPANVKLTAAGDAKVLDFGLAKALEPGEGIGSTASAANSPTFTAAGQTQAGIILGTAAYMAPEQARGKAVDRRADLWALGCVLYEMLTAARAFDGETVTDLLSAVVSKEPDWSRLPPATPPAVERLLRRSLRKDVRARLQSAGDARVELDEALSAPGDRMPAASVPSASRRWLGALAFTAAGIAIGSAAVTLLQPRAPAAADPVAMRYSIQLPSSLQPLSASVSPDGRWIVASALGPTGSLGLWLRPMDGQTFQQIAGTEQGSGPAWSPDSRELAFFTRGTLSRIPISRGAPTVVADIAKQTGTTIAVGQPMAWGANGTILLGTLNKIYRVPASGGVMSAVTTPEGASAHSAPWWLPGNRFLFTEWTSIVGTGGGLLMQSLAGGAPTRLTDSRTIARYTPQGLLVARFTGTSVATISAHRFDVERGALEQPGVVLAADVVPLFSASDTGVLVYGRAASGSDCRFQWMDSKGAPIGDAFDVSGAGAFNLSRDERLVAFNEADNIMLRDLARGVTTRIIQGPGVLEPILSPDGRRVAYSITIPGRYGIRIRPAAGGRDEIVSTSPGVTLVEDWSRDGRFLLVVDGATSGGPSRGLILPLEGDRTPIVFADLPVGSGLDEPRFSPDGRWIVYNAADGGQQQVYLVPVPPTGERWQVSIDGGAQGRWRADGTAVDYLSRSGQLMEVTVKTGSAGPPQIGRPRLIFETGMVLTPNVDQYAPNADGTRFLLRRPIGNVSGSEMQVIVNWPTLLNEASRASATR
jgi:serine/threonine protein kinase